MPNVPNVNCCVCKDPLSRSHYEEMSGAELNDLFMARGWVCLMGEHESTLGETRYVCQNCTKAIIKHAPAYLKPKPVRIADDFSGNVDECQMFTCFEVAVDYDCFEYVIMARLCERTIYVQASLLEEAWKKFLEELHGPRDIEAVANAPVLSEGNDDESS